MRSFIQTIHIDRSPAQVWAYMMDFEKAPRWRNLVCDMRTRHRRAAAHRQRSGDYVRPAGEPAVAHGARCGCSKRRGDSACAPRRRR